MSSGAVGSIISMSTTYEVMSRKVVEVLYVYENLDTQRVFS